MIPHTIPFRFPHAREGQEALILDAYETFQNKKILLAHAETGLGKTDASLSAALAVALNSEPRSTILFLTPKNAQHEIAMDALKGINQKHDLKIRAIDLVGKKHLCLEEKAMQKEGKTFYEMCKKLREREACGFYSNARGHTPLQREKAKLARKMFEQQMKSIHSSREIKQASQEFLLGNTTYGMCPYETSLELAKKADVIVADYYHIFSPAVSETVLPKLGKKMENCIMIVDEAHNLPERVRGLMSASITSRQLQKAGEEAKILGEKELKETLNEMENQMIEQGEKMEKKEKLLPNEPFFFDTEKKDWKEFSMECEAKGVEYLEKSGKESSTLIHVGEFFEKWGNQNEGLARILKKREFYGDYSVGVKALDPRNVTQKVFSQMHASMLMSGTLFPLEMYADVLGIPNEKLKKGFYASPFPKENRLNIIGTNTSTKYAQRSESEFEKMARTTGEIVNQIPGNSIVYFPSFKLLSTIGNKMKDYTMRPLLFQKENMKMKETQKLLEEFKQHGHGFGAVLLACTSGSFAEGMDFPGNELLGAVIVGIPLAEMNAEVNALVNYYQQRFGKGWEYGYIFPAMQKAIQASGRVIRSPTDQGIVVLLDSRYTWENYKKCLPPTQTFLVAQNPAEKVKEFWQRKESPAFK